MLSSIIFQYYPLAALIGAFSLDDAIFLHFLQVFGHGTSVDSEGFCHLSGGDF